MCWDVLSEESKVMTEVSESNEPVALSKNEYEAYCYAFGCHLEIDARDYDLLQRVKEGGWMTVRELTFPVREFRRLLKRELVENRGFGLRVAIAGEIQMSIFRGENPWLGGPILSYEKAIEKGVIRMKR